MMKSSFAKWFTVGTLKSITLFDLRLYLLFVDNEKTDKYDGIKPVTAL